MIVLRKACSHDNFSTCHAARPIITFSIIHRDMSRSYQFNTACGTKIMQAPALGAHQVTSRLVPLHTVIIVPIYVYTTKTKSLV